MTVIFASLLRYYFPEEDESKRPVPLGNANGILDSILRYIPHKRKLVCVANDGADCCDNDAAARILSRSLELAGLKFEKTIVLDDRNAKSAEAVCDGASLIYLRGGKCICQLEFLRRVGMEKILRETNALVIGVSAGAMDLGKTVANFPEELSDIPRPRWLTGLGITDKIIIPHFDGKTCAYQFPCEQFDIAKDYILPMSEGREFWGISNDGYITIDENGDTKTFGDVCLIKDGKISDI